MSFVHRNTAAAAFRACSRAGRARSAMRMTRGVTTSAMHENDPYVLETEKHHNLARGPSKSMISNAPGWNERLATVSEANVKADHALGVTFPELVTSTVAFIKGLDFEDVREESTSTFVRDAVNGPLSKAKGKLELQAE